MTWAILIQIALKVLQERYAAGFPLLKALLALWGIDFQKAADEDTEAITVGAAPDEVKNMIVGWFEKLAANSGRPMMRLAIGFLVRYIPGVADQIWDGLFQAGHVATPAPVQAAVECDEAAILAD